MNNRLHETLKGKKGLIDLFDLTLFCFASEMVFIFVNDVYFKVALHQCLGGAAGLRNRKPSVVCSPETLQTTPVTLR